MGKAWTLLISACVLLYVCSFVEGEIHRAKAKPKPLRHDRHRATSTTKPGHTTETWVLSMISAALVGLSGIFPLVIIPLEAGDALRKGAPAARLKLLLSFAVGGMLGDVFLHLLPEAWKHVEPGDHMGHNVIGYWVLTGLLTFLVIEKMFPDSHDDEEEEEEDKEAEQIQDTSTLIAKTVQNGTTENLKKRKTGDKTNNSNGHIQNGHVKNGYTNGHIQNGHVQNGNANGHIQNGHANGHTHQNGHIQSENEVEKPEKEQQIKTSGWLNLLANIIDNFTHGLAVAASYCIDTKGGILTTIIILLHEIPHEVGDFAILLRSGFDRWKAAKCQLLTATGGLFGALTALIADSAQEAGDRTAWILPFTSGGFIYVSLVAIVPDLLKENNPRESFKQVICVLLGLSVMVLVALFLDEHTLPIWLST